MIKITLKNGTIIEMDAYHREAIQDVTRLNRVASDTASELQSTSGVLSACRICRAPLYRLNQRICKSKECHRKAHNAYHKIWAKRKQEKQAQKAQRAQEEQNPQPLQENVPQAV